MSGVIEQAGVLQQENEFLPGGIERAQHLLSRPGAVQQVEDGRVSRGEPTQDDGPDGVDADLQGGAVPPEPA